MFSIGSNKVRPFRTLWSWQAHTTPIAAITIITIMIDGITHSQMADPGGISQGIITQKKSGTGGITGERADTEVIEGKRGINGNIYQNMKSQSGETNTILIEGE